MNESHARPVPLRATVVLRRDRWRATKAETTRHVARQSSRADVTDELDPLHTQFVPQDALEMIVNMKPTAAATRAGCGVKAVGTAKALLVLGEFVDIEDDQRAAVKARLARVHQAGLGRRWAGSGPYAVTTRAILRSRISMLRS